MDDHNHVKMKKRHIIIVCCLSAAVLLMAIIFIILSVTRPQKQFLSQVFVSEAKVAELAADTDSSPTKYYVRIALVNPTVSSAKLTEDTSWVEVSSEYYIKHKTNDSIGVLVGNYDIYKERLFGGGQSFDKNIWGIEDIFDNVQDAEETYPKKSFDSPATLIKKVSDNDRYLFVVTYEDREISVDVDKEVFDKYSENETVTCSLFGYGDYVKITKIA